MILTSTFAIVNYRHLPEEVEELSTAIIPLAENIRAVSTRWERERMHAILACEQFRYRDAKAVKKMLENAAKHARANAGSYFWPQEILAAVEILEEAVKCYWSEFEEQEREIIPIS